MGTILVLVLRTASSLNFLYCVCFLDAYSEKRLNSTVELAHRLVSPNRQERKKADIYIRHEKGL
jgi:hypothetical protein